MFFFENIVYLIEKKKKTTKTKKHQIKVENVYIERKEEMIVFFIVIKKFTNLILS